MKTKIYIVIALLTLNLLSCHLLQKHKQTVKKLSQKEQVQLTEQHHMLTQKSAFFLLDSSHNDFTMQLWPKGKFNFSAANGFEGEAEKIVIKSKQKQQKLISIKQQSQLDSTLRKIDYSNNKETNTMVQKEKLRFGNNWIWLIVVPAVYMLYLVYRRIKSFSLFQN